MLKQLLVILSMISLISLIALAQEKPDTEKSEKKECSHSCCGTKESKSEVNIENNVETQVVQIWNNVCPVEGGKIKSDSPTIEHDGKLIGFCCSGCETKFEKDPETYLKNLNDDGSQYRKKS